MNGGSKLNMGVSTSATEYQNSQKSLMTMQSSRIKVMPNAHITNKKRGKLNTDSSSRGNSQHSLIYTNYSPKRHSTKQTYEQSLRLNLK